MRKVILLLIMTQLSLVNFGQIIADHTVVAQYDKIPQEYIDKIKKMWVVLAGESHARGYGFGLEALESSYPAYKVNYITNLTTPEAYTTDHLRVSHLVWGDVNNATGWVHFYGEEDWFTSAGAIAQTKTGITYCNSNSLTIGALGFGWCWDPAYTDMTDYLSATQAYIDYCNTNNYATKVFFTTGPVDGSNQDGETGYLKYLSYEAIRSYANNNPTRILFDYADILCYDDNGSLKTVSWNGHTYPSIASTNLTPTVDSYHISVAGTVRLAKAMWWMLARMAGWDGITTGIKKNESLETASVIVDYNSDEIRIHSTDSYLSGSISLYNLQGYLIEKKSIDGNVSTLNKSAISPGIYFIKVTKSNLSETKKIIILK